jgi:hypothetical protein
MKIKLNENAERYFNEKLESFLLKLALDKTPKRVFKKVESSDAHYYIAANITKEDVVEFTSKGYVSNITGEQIARYFAIDGGESVGFDQNAYAELVPIVESLYKKKEINKFLSRSFLYDCVFKWFEEKYKGKIDNDTDFISYLKEKSEIAINKYTIYLPISFLSIQKPFEVGKVMFNYMTRLFCDKYLNNVKEKMIKHGNFDEKNYQKFEERFRTKYQGTVFGRITIEAEQDRSVQSAKLLVGKALEVLRFFSPSAFVPEIPCYFCVMGQVDIPKSHYFVFKNNENLPTAHEGIDERRMHRWYLGVNEFSRISGMGLGQAANLFFKKNLTDFEKSILNSMHLFNRALTSREFQDKIVFVMVSAENLFLRNTSSPIQDTVGTNLAFFSETDTQKRKDVLDTVKRAYIIRSQFLHHGKEKENWELLKNLQHIVWTAIINAMFSSNRLKSRDEFFEYIKNLIFS